jgi:hypothetical protein
VAKVTSFRPLRPGQRRWLAEAEFPERGRNRIESGISHPRIAIVGRDLLEGPEIDLHEGASARRFVLVAPRSGEGLRIDQRGGQADQKRA